MQTRKFSLYRFSTGSGITRFNRFGRERVLSISEDMRSSRFGVSPARKAAYR